MNVILEDKDFVAVSKPAGVLTHKTFHSSGETLADEVLAHYPEIKNVGDEPILRPGVVHRLDKDTTGVVIFARNQEFFNHLKNCFKEGKVKKIYKALVWGKTPKNGTIEVPIGLKSGSTKRSVSAKNMKMVKSAITEYKTEKYFSLGKDEFSLVQVFPKTGRTHQIRVHFLHIHHPIVGDPIYGKRKNPFELTRQFLHAESIEFPLASGSRIKIEADLPEELQKILKSPI